MLAIVFGLLFCRVLPFAPIAIELVVAALAATEPRPAGHGFAGEAGAAEDGGAQEWRDSLLAGQPLLLGRYELPDFERGDGYEFLVDEVSTRQRTIEHRPALAQQVLNA